MIILSGRWKTGQKIMDNIELLKFELRETKNTSETQTIYIYNINFDGTDGVMQIHTKFGKVMDTTFLNCGFSRNLTMSRDETLLFVANYLLSHVDSQKQTILQKT